jgi:protein O-mannosyl-transferase
LRVNPAQADAHNNLGVAHQKRGRLGEAATEFREALRLRPDFANARQNLNVVEGQLPKPR